MSDYDAWQELACNAVAALANDVREPERYRKWYQEVLGKLQDHFVRSAELEAIVRKLVDAEAGYVDLEVGIVDVRVSLTDAQIALCRELMEDLQ